MIDPKDVIKRVSIEELCLSAENYYKAIVDPTPQMGKPFTSLIEAPELLINMGLLLSGLQLAKTMTVLDFAAGTGWFSRFLNQLQCSTISCDTSKTALEIGKRLFKEYPIIGNYVSEPQFLYFDGHKINLPDNSVDRIICFDAFHHIPNQEEVLSEFARVLKEGGIAGFSEPGKNHSQAPQSQFEMANYNVLENDIFVDEIFTIAKKFGFSNFSCKVVCDKDLSLFEYNSILESPTSPTDDRLKKDILNNIATIMNHRTIFFLYKGKYFPDSRGHAGLSHFISVNCNKYVANLNQPFIIPVNTTNTGEAKWLCSNINDIGVVKLGAHLYDSKDRLINLDFSRSNFEKDILPGETVENILTVVFSIPGLYKLSLDLVSETVCWFEIMGSKPINIEVLVQ